VFVSVSYKIYAQVITFQAVYIKSHTRASPYFVGIAVGYLLHHLRDYKQKVGVVSVSSVLLIPCKW